MSKCRPDFDLQKHGVDPKRWELNRENTVHNKSGHMCNCLALEFRGGASVLLSMSNWPMQQHHEGST